MKLIHEIEIEGFRSIRKESLTQLGNFTALAGLNNSGKSNVLRALNAFFKGETDPGEVVALDRDYFRPDWLKKKKKRVRINVTFDLPAQFKFRKGLEAARDFLGGNQFKVGKEWAFGQAVPLYYLNGELKQELESRQRIDQFLSLIKLRYIPNRVLPIDVIRSEHQALRDVLVRRLGRKKVEAEAFESIRHASEKLVSSLATRFSKAAPGAGAVRLATPTSWNEMVFAFGYRLTKDNVEIDDSFQGSGIQSLLMLETLYLIDRDYFQKFGWQQAVVWAVEEPESSMHCSLEAQVASYLSSISTEPENRLQILCTTHSDLMLQYADKVVAVEQKNSRSTFSVLSDGLSAIERLSKAGVSRWVDPLLHHPLDPLILVEGKFDCAFLSAALALTPKSREVKISYLENLEPQRKTGGKDDLQRYVQEHASAIKSRSKLAPVLVVLDWDAAGKRDSYQKPFGPLDPFKVVAWPMTALNPKLGETFHGVERAYSDRLIEEGEKMGVKIYRAADGTCSTDAGDYGKTKQTLHAVVKQGLRESDLGHLKAFLGEILQAVGAV